MVFRPPTGRGPHPGSRGRALQTPNLRSRTIRGGMLLFATVIVLFDMLVFGAVRDELETNLEANLEQRLTTAVEHAEEFGPEEAAETLVADGIPAVLRTADGEVIAAEPLVGRFGNTPPAPAGVVEPRASMSTTLDDGTVVEVFASRAGIESTLNRLLLIIMVGTVGALALAYGVLMRLVNETLDPLAKVAATAEQITEGARSERLEPDQPETELGRMATSFDEMLDALEATIDRAEEEQERSRRFLADAAHQLRTPVAGVRSAVELLLRETDPEMRDRLLAHTVRETARISKLISALLHVARLDQGRPPERQRTDLVALCEGEIERVRDLAPHLQIELEATDEAREPVPVDPEEIDEVLANLLDNARRHAAERVEVRVEHADGEVVVSVRDDGPGLVAGSEELVFERFATLDGRGGSGLGLAIARGVARAHGGDVTYEDHAFVMRLPREADDLDADLTS
jgi:two-component system, OmpR family, sensor kinase